MLLRSQVMREVYKSKMQGAVDRRRSIPKEVFLEIKIPIPPMQIQNSIVKKQQEIEGATIMIKNLKHEVNKNLGKLWEKKAQEPNPNHFEDFNEVLRKAVPPIKPHQT